MNSDPLWSRQLFIRFVILVYICSDVQFIYVDVPQNLCVVYTFQEFLNNSTQGWPSFCQPCGSTLTIGKTKDSLMWVCLCVCVFVCVCVCVCGLVRTYIRGQFCVFNHLTGDVPGPYNHANQLLINFWTCLIYSMHILKIEPVRSKRKEKLCIGGRTRPRLAD